MLLAELESMPPAMQALVLAEEVAWRQRRRKLGSLFPPDGPLRRELYPKQMAFFAAGATHRQRAFMAGNRVGKTLAALYEVTCHLTGIYPDWWRGKRFDRPIKAWVCGDTSKSVREGVQEKLLGPMSDPGTGILPGELIEAREIKQGEALDWVRVRHRDGGLSQVYFKSYDQGREAFQFTEVDAIVLDEEPPIEIYEECVTRTMTTSGIVMLTFTPLRGVTQVVQRYMREGTLIEGPVNDSRYLVQCSWDDVPHLDEATKREIAAEYPEHVRAARTRGIPVLGSGRVFPVEEEAIICDPPDPPAHWVVIGGMDFGIDHPFAAVRLLWDRDEDVIYVERDFSATGVDSIPPLVWPRLKNWGDIPWAWPQDGLQRDKGSGIQIAQAYREAGFRMLPEHATFEDGSRGLEAGIMQMLERMKTGRWKVSRTCELWLKEFRAYHRKDGQIVKVGDDVISASRYAFMMRRFAQPVGVKRKLKIYVGM
jgi:phage terminase large subunit-like protein